MPKVRMFFSNRLGLSFRPPNEIGYRVQCVASEALSTRCIHLEPGDVEFIPTPVEPHNNLLQGISIHFEVESIGSKERREQMDEKAQTKLKNALLEVCQESTRNHIFSPRDLSVKLTYTT